MGSNGERPEEPVVEGLPTGAGTPEAVTEQPDLRFEHQAEAKWLGDPFGLRLFAVALTARKRRARGDAVSPAPWLAVGVTAAIAVALIALVWIVATRLG
ncbi:MAG: hypothetical protein ACM3OO_00800 [Planctomycetaceae bacterium]